MRDQRQHGWGVMRLSMVKQHIRTYFLRSMVALAALVAFGTQSQLLAVILDPPILQCASVDVNNDVTLTWEPPNDPGADFLQYEVYRADNIAGPFVLLVTIPVLAQTTYLDSPTNAGNGPVFYYMTTVSTAPPPNTSIPSDTVSTLFLEVFQSAPLGNANLAWNASALATGAATTFSIWMEYPIGTWEMLDEVPSTTFAYQHEISICEDSITFRVDIGHGQGCISSSNLDGDVFADLTPPTAPDMSVVTVDTLTGQATMVWEPSPEGDTDGYIILVVTPGGGILIDTVYGQFNNTYTWLASTANLAPESFTVAAFDTCQTGTPPSPNTSATKPPHTTMFLSNSYERCTSRVSLSWTPYVGWPVAMQHVLVSTDGGPWALLASLSGTMTTYVHQGEPFRTYCYAVQAFDSTGVWNSLSNRSCRTTVYPSRPAFNYLRNVTVTGPTRITVVDSVDMSGLASAYILERSADGGPFEVIATAPWDAGPVIVFDDENVDPSRTGYRYRVVVNDSCGTQAVVSNLGGNIVLRARPELQGRNLLDWNGYAAWAGSTVLQVIQRSVEDDTLDILTVLPDTPWTFTDDVQDLTGTTGRFCYRVEAVEGGNPSGINAVSVSNVACAVQEDLVYIPSAFTPDGFNPIFKPVMAYVDVSEYELSIINRWGQVVWVSNDPDVGWDGEIEGIDAQIGIYGYYCTFKNGAGRRFEKRGTVTLIAASQ